ncbi:MAG: PHP domain-containing protein [Candidatus Zipacnadales bacterium]
MRRGIDYHIHTFYQKCGNETLTVEKIIRKAESLNMTSIAITDHLNHRDQLPNFHFIRRDIEQIATDLEVWFGCELNFDRCDGAFVYDEQVREEYGFQMAIGGIHSTYSDSQDPLEIIDIQQRHHMRTLQDPLVDVLVHPYWFGKAEIDKRSPEWWQDLMENFPEDRITELAQASAAHNCAIELNSSAIFHNHNYNEGFQRAYVEFIRALAARGALFTFASDAHDISQLGWSDYAEGLLDGLAIPETQVWRPSERT